MFCPCFLPVALPYNSLREKKGTAVRHVVTVRHVHGKEVFAVRWHETTQQRMAAWQRMKKTHGKDLWTAKTPQCTR
jgi:hypothetical protein